MQQDIELLKREVDQATFWKNYPQSQVREPEVGLAAPEDVSALPPPLKWYERLREMAKSPWFWAMAGGATYFVVLHVLAFGKRKW